MSGPVVWPQLGSILMSVVQLSPKATCMPWGSRPSVAIWEFMGRIIVRTTFIWVASIASQGHRQCQPGHGWCWRSCLVLWPMTARVWVDNCDSWYHQRSCKYLGSGSFPQVRWGSESHAEPCCSWSHSELNDLCPQLEPCCHLGQGYCPGPGLVHGPTTVRVCIDVCASWYHQGHVDARDQCCLLGPY